MIGRAQKRPAPRAAQSRSQEPRHGHTQTDRVRVGAHVTDSENELRTTGQSEVSRDLILEWRFLEHLRHRMHTNRPSSCFQPHPLAAATGIDQCRDAFIVARDHYPTTVAGELLPDAIDTLLPKQLAEDRLLGHEVANVPPG